jgi:hypothetical protein
MEDNVVFTKQSAKALKAKSAAHKKDETFFFDGREYIKQYADYLVEYLEGSYGKL